MNDVTIERARNADLAEILRNFGASALKALTSPDNAGSIAFHRRTGFTDMTLAPDYPGNGRTRIVMRRLLPLTTLQLVARGQPLEAAPERSAISCNVMTLRAR